MKNLNITPGCIAMNEVKQIDHFEEMMLKAQIERVEIIETRRQILDCKKHTVEQLVDSLRKQLGYNKN